MRKNGLRCVVYALIGVMLTYTTGCDAVTPHSEPVLVVEAFVETGREPGEVRLRKTLAMDAVYRETDAAVDGAEVWMTVGEVVIPYLPDAHQMGVYAPAHRPVLEEGTEFTLQATWQHATASASGRLPRTIRIDRVETMVPDDPIEVVLLDSLQLDSLQTGARSGYVYPVEVTLWWDGGVQPDPGDSLNWIRTQLRPYTAPVPGVVEYLFRAEQIVREDRVSLDRGSRRWTGVYLVPVDTAEDPLPPHSLKVALLRSGDDYARFASSRSAPERREPVSNVRGGIGIVAGVAVDSLTIHVN